MLSSSRSFAAMLSLTLAPFAACAQSSEADALAGPKVAVPSSSTVKSIVVRDSSGKVERLETRPEAAAVGMLGLTADEKKPVDDALAQHSAEVAKLLRENRALFLKIQAALQGNASQAELLPLFLEFRPIAASLIENPLRERVSAALPEGTRAEFARLVREYMDAINQEEMARKPGMSAVETPTARQKDTATENAAMDEMAPASSKAEMESPRSARRAARRAAEREEVGLLLRQMGRTLGAVVTEGREQLAEFYKAVDATPEQQAKIEKIVLDPEFGEPGNRTATQRTAMLRAMASSLTPGQQRKAREFLTRD